MRLGNTMNMRIMLLQNGVYIRHIDCAPLRSCHGNTKHRLVYYEMEWIYMMSGPESLKLTLEIKKKERKIDKIHFFFYYFKTAYSGIPDCFHGCMGA